MTQWCVNRQADSNRQAGANWRHGRVAVPALVLICVLKWMAPYHSAHALAAADDAPGSCCLSGPCQCLSGLSIAQCNTAGGIHQGPGSPCIADRCDCLERACCDPAGRCVGDRTQAECVSSANVWHADASCGATDGLPLPQCNRFDQNLCHWDNGPPLNDGGACRSHVHAGGAGQLPRYDHGAADDFILRGPNAVPCAVSSVRSWMRMRPSGLDGNATPDPFYDWVGVNVTVYRNTISPSTGLPGPAGHGRTPLDGTDLNPKEDDESAGIVFARHFPLNEGAVTFAFQDGLEGEYGPFCDPPPADGLETEHIYRVDVAIDPPILLNKNTPYWLSVQGVFPFNDGQRETLQSWWMPSARNTGLRGMSQRSENLDYLFPVACSHGPCVPPQYVPIWVPNNVDLVPPGYPPNAGNAGTCPGAPPPRTRFDFAFMISGSKHFGGVPNDLCANAPEVFEGSTPFDTFGTGTDGPISSCGNVNQDVWFKYSATCTGKLTASTCGSEFDSRVVIYDGHVCNPLDPELSCDVDRCLHGAEAETYVHETGLFLIRVGGAGTASGKGILQIRCEETCGSPSRGDCCTAHDPEVACNNQLCCAIVCTTPGEEVCCDDPSVGWDSECTQVAFEIPQCRCPCAFSCPSNAVHESEPCGQSTNAGCTIAPSSPAVYSDLGTLNFGPEKKACGTIYALDGQRDTDWWKFRVADSNHDGEAQIRLSLNGSAPVGVMILKGSGSDDCDDDDDGVRDPMVVFDSVATAACHTETLTVCVPADADGEDYVVFVSTFETDGEGGLGDGIFDELSCAPTPQGSRNDYTFSIGVSDVCPSGACCTCPGGCADGLTEPECRDRQGTFAGENSQCNALPPEVNCVSHAHGCTQATAIACGQTVMVELAASSVSPEADDLCGGSQELSNASAWFSFVMPAGVHSAKIHTCDSANPGRDSVLGIYRGGCCQQSSRLAPTKCSDDACGFTGRLSSICAGDLNPGETYYVKLSNGSSLSPGRFALTLDCPCTGSCCDGQAKTCDDHTPWEACSAPLRFGETVTCTELNPQCGLGACCAPNGTCSEIEAEDCAGCSVHWPGATCGEMYCNATDTCGFATAGDLLRDRASIGYRSQFAPDTGLFVERADDFILSGCSTVDCPHAEPCPITTIDYAVFHRGHDVGNGCFLGGGPGCTDTPADYQGIILTISEDSGDPIGTGQPDCLPQCNHSACNPGADGDFHEGQGCRFGVVFGPAAGEAPPNHGNRWTYAGYPQPEGISLIRLKLDPPFLAKPNTRYWLAVSHILPETGKYEVVWQASSYFNGVFTRGYHSQGEPAFTASNVRNDMLFDLGGREEPPGCGSCKLFGDHVSPDCRVDLDDLLCVLRGFSVPGSCDGGDLFPCGGNGVVDVDDILAELAAYVGFFACPHPCPGGACCGAFSGIAGDRECRDMSHSPSGMSRSDCYQAGGTYFCDGSTCPRAECP